MSKYQDLWSEFDFYFSSVTSQKFLYTSYCAQNIHDASSLSFQNTYRFIYYLEHGKSYLLTAETSPMNIKPMLLFYGYIQLLKACLVVVDPNYPESTQVLAHGVTSRKKKRQNYEFLYDEVKVQKNGLFSHIGSKIFSLSFAEGEKYIMKDMLDNLPELHKLVQKISHKQSLIKLTHYKDDIWCIPNNILDCYHMTTNRFHEFLRKFLPYDYLVKQDQSNSFQLNMRTNSETLVKNTLFRYHVFEKSYYIPNRNSSECQIPEILQYYLILYNLSMLSRYETEWWGELLHSFSNTDYPFIIQFTELALFKIPFLITNLLNTFVIDSNGFI